MTIWKFKSCVKCGGDVFIEREVEGLCARCLQCGHRTYPRSKAQILLQQREQKSRTLIKQY